jgi:hypothetical protein
MPAKIGKEGERCKKVEKNILKSIYIFVLLLLF